MATSSSIVSETYLRGAKGIMLLNKGCPSYPVSLADIAAVLDTCPTDDLDGVRSISIVGPAYDGLRPRMPASVPVDFRVP